MGRIVVIPAHARLRRRDISRGRDAEKPKADSKRHPRAVVPMPAAATAAMRPVTAAMARTGAAAMARRAAMAARASRSGFDAAVPGLVLHLNLLDVSVKGSDASAS